MKQPPMTIRRCSSGDIQKSILIDLIHQQRLSLPVFWVILDYAQTVDPQVPNVEFLGQFPQPSVFRLCEITTSGR
jgi:hypothetical protein